MSAGSIHTQWGGAVVQRQGSLGIIVEFWLTHNPCMYQTEVQTCSPKRMTKNVRSTIIDDSHELETI